MLRHFDGFVIWVQANLMLKQTQHGASTPRPVHHSTTKPLTGVIKIASTDGFEMCGLLFLLDPSTFGAATKTRLESSIKKFNPHFVCRRVCLH